MEFIIKTVGAVEFASRFLFARSSVFMAELAVFYLNL